MMNEQEASDYSIAACGLEDIEERKDCYSTREMTSSVCRNVNNQYPHL
jgi:hypothetical protein